MVWIESHQELRDHPKTIRLARALDLSRAAAIGHLHLFWWWALTYADDGDLRPYSDHDVAAAADWPDDPARLVEALTTAGFLDADRRIHDWHDYAGRLLARRESDAARKRAVRRTSGGRRADVRGTACVTGTGTLTGTGTITGNRTGTGDRGPTRAAAAASPAEDEGPSRGAPPTGSAVAPRRLQPVPKPSRAQEVIDRLAAAGLQVTLSGRDIAAIRDSGANPADIADAYLALARGEWGDDFDRAHLSLYHVINNLGGFLATRRAPPPVPSFEVAPPGWQPDPQWAQRLAPLLRAQMTGANFTTWLEEATYARRGRILEVVVPARFIAEHVHARMRALLLKLASDVEPEISAVRVLVAPKRAAATRPA